MTHRADQGEPSCASSISPTRTVLVVDDDVGVRNVIREFLEENRITVIEARSGEMAVQLFRASHEEIDLVLLDVNMPGLDGPQTLFQLVQLDPKVRRCLMTGDPSSYQDESLLETGAIGVLGKPFVLQWVLDILTESGPNKVTTIS